MAAGMPPLQVYGQEREVIAGHDLIATGVTEVQGNPVDEHKQYRRNKQVQKPLDHAKQMKKAYMKNGHAGVIGYVHAVDSYVKQHQAQSVQTKEPL